MKIVPMSVEILYPEELDRDRVYKRLEIAGRTCYKSEDKISEGSAEKLLKHIVKRGHLSVLEHEKVTVRFICDRGFSHETVRHRIASFSQESTRYCDYGGELQVIEPLWSGDEDKINMRRKYWITAMERAEEMYKLMREQGSPPQEARHVLPIGVKTELIITANLREWKHIFSLRCAKAAHPHIRFLMIQLEDLFAEALPVLFGEDD